MRDEGCRTGVEELFFGHFLVIYLFIYILHDSVGYYFFIGMARSSIEMFLGPIYTIIYYTWFY